MTSASRDTWLIFLILVVVVAIWFMLLAIWLAIIEKKKDDE